MRKKVLIVDDMEVNREILSEILSDDFEIIEAADGEEALAILDKSYNEIIVVLLDLVMPKMDGYSVLETMNTKSWFSRIPVLIITGEDSIKIEKKCYNLGIADFIRKPFDNTIVRKRVRNITDYYQYKDGLEEKVKEQTEVLSKQYRLLKIQANELKKSNASIIDVLGTVVECRSMESGEHVRRIKGYTEILARCMMENYPEYELDEKKIEVIVSASALHDIGKISIPDNILMKPGKLTSEEYEYMKSHTLRGVEILNNINGVWSEDYGSVSTQICRWHHERYDGKGYPDGLKKDEIPISAQFVSIADVYDALVNERVYKAAYTKEQAFQMIVGGECGVFSPKLLECFRISRTQFEMLADQTME